MSKILNGDSNAITDAISADSISKRKPRKAMEYYNYRHDILDNVILYMDKNGNITEDKHSTNTKIPHPFFTELVDQTVGYILANPPEMATGDDVFDEYLKEYWTDDMHVLVQEALEGSSIKSHEYVFVRMTQDDKITFQISDSLKTFEIFDDAGDRVGIGRHYTRPVRVRNELVDVNHFEIWTEQDVTFYIENKDKKWELNTNVAINPRPHVLATQIEDDNDEPVVMGRSYGRIPFFRLKNNKQLMTDLEPIKELIDDYDIMACYLSNNLQDFNEVLYVVSGYKGSDKAELYEAIKGRKMVKTGEGGDVDIKTVDVPVEGRKAKLAIDKEAIYKFGMGFDSSQISDSSGNVTNVQILAGYELLNMKASKKEKYLRELIRWMNELIVEDINRRIDAEYDHNQIKVTFERETTVNRQESANVEKVEADTKKTMIDTILQIQSLLDAETILQEICTIYGLDYKEISAKKKKDAEIDASVDGGIDASDDGGE